MKVLDASAVLAFLQGEEGADEVESTLPEAVIGAANWAEVLQKIRARNADVAIARSLLLSYGVRIEAVSASDGEQAAALWQRGDGLSLGERLCLALGRRLNVPVLTADRAWGASEAIVQLRASG